MTMLGPWRILFIVSSILFGIYYVIKQQMNALPDLVATAEPEYDYIIVGGGSAGCALAHGLAQLPGLKILLLEAGPDDRDDFNLTVPIKAFDKAHTELDWGYRTVPQKHALKGFKDQCGWWYRGKLLGGTSNTNDMLYLRGLAKDYDNWGLEGWWYKDVLKHFINMEDNENADFVKTGYHKMGHQLKVGRSKTNSLTNLVLRANKEMGAPVIDINAQLTEGVVEVQSTLRKGVRHSATRAFLNAVPYYTRVNNLHIMANALVTKVLIKNELATGVQFVKNGTVVTVKAKREIILSAGTVGSAQLLLLSGVGPKKHLESLKIPMVSDVPVGDNLHDSLQFEFPVAVNASISITEQRLTSIWEKLKYTLFGKGMLASNNGIEVVRYSNTRHNQNQSNWPDLFLQFKVMLQGQDYARALGMDSRTVEELSMRSRFTDGFACYSSSLRPKSRGTLRLRSIDPGDFPLIDPNYLERSEDVEVILEGIKLCKKLLSTATMKEIGAQYADGPSSSCKKFGYDSDDYWRCLIRARAHSTHQPVGTCRMGKADDSASAVDPQLRVRGVKGLRVADDSIIPSITSGGTNIPTYMIGVKAAHLVLADLPKEQRKAQLAQEL